MINKYLISGPVPREVLDNFILKMSKMTDAGGHSFFLGQVRADKIDGKKVKAIEYSAYESLVEAEADTIKASILSDFPDVKTIEIVHSNGLVKAGGISLVVIVTAGHRSQSIEACSKTVELVKERLPVWKKEIFEDESHNWK
jgi:molybdopterin synthase catalytic subunit